MKALPNTLFIFFSVAIAVFVVPHITLASNYGVAPLVIDHELEKRDIVTETITITNRENKVVRVYPAVNEVSVSDGGTIQNFTESSMVDRTNSITSWLEIGRGRIELQPLETKDVSLTIRINPDVKAGEYHAFVGFGEGSNRPEAETKIRNGQAPGTIVRIAVDKVQDQFLRLEKFTVERFITEDAISAISYVVHNPGNSPVIPAGEIIFYDNNGTEVGSVPVNTEGVTVGSEENLELTASVPLELTLGKYKAFLSVEYGEHLTASVHDTAFFYVLPLKQLIIIFSIVLFLAILIALYVHRKYDMGAGDPDDADEVPMYLRSEVSEGKEHDIDLSKKND